MWVEKGNSRCVQCYLVFKKRSIKGKRRVIGTIPWMTWTDMLPYLKQVTFEQRPEVTEKQTFMWEKLFHQGNCRQKAPDLRVCLACVRDTVQMVLYWEGRKCQNMGRARQLGFKLKENKRGNVYHSTKWKLSASSCCVTNNPEIR